MSEQEQNKCVAFLLAVAFDSGASKEDIQRVAKKLLARLPKEEVARAAGTKINFGDTARTE